MSESGKDIPSNTKTTKISNIIPPSIDTKLGMQRSSEDLKMNGKDLTVAALEIQDPWGTQSPHLVDYYNFWKPYLLTPEINNSSKEDDLKLLPYSTYFKMVVSKTTESNKICEDNSNGLKVIAYLNNDNQEDQYTLKRVEFNYDEMIIGNGRNDLIDPKERFTKKNFQEYIRIFIFSASPYGAKVIGFRIVDLQDRNIIASEILMTYEGKILITILPITKEENLVNCFLHIIYATYFLECHNLLHNYLKPSNITIDLTKKIQFPKLIDFDSGKILSKTMDENEWIGDLNFTGGYASPEILKIIDLEKKGFSLSNNKHQFNPWFSQIFSLGVIMLQAMSQNEADFFNKPDKKDFDNLKIGNESNYQTFIDKVLNQLAEQYPKRDIFLNWIWIARLCISYEPSSRPTSVELMHLTKDINTTNAQKLEEEWKNCLEKRKKIYLEKCKKYLGKSDELMLPQSESIIASDLDKLNQKIDNYKIENLHLEVDLEKEMKENEKLMKEKHLVEQEKQILENEKSILKKEKRKLKIDYQMKVDKLNSKIQELEDLLKNKSDTVRKNLSSFKGDILSVLPGKTQLIGNSIMIDSKTEEDKKSETIKMNQEKENPNKEYQFLEEKLNSNALMGKNKEGVQKEISGSYPAESIVESKDSQLPLQDNFGGFNLFPEVKGAKDESKESLKGSQQSEISKIFNISANSDSVEISDLTGSGEKKEVKNESSKI